MLSAVPSLRVVHIADVHWRGLSRHGEYRQVFEAFYAKAAACRPDVIYIGGDIFHTKTQNISPEILECLDWWFTELTKIAPVVVTLGNHDGNLMNRSRQDAISPVIKMLRNPRITLHKTSGVYPTGVPGFNWCVFSCFDEKKWKDVKPVDGDVNIAVFHGSVFGSTTDQEFELKGEVDVEFFDGYDFAMLGDIHKMQFLGYRDCIDGERRPWIAYCGSTIQQNYGEAPEHGFLFWDIRSRDDFNVEFVPLPNPNRFVTIDWTGDVDQVAAIADEYPDGARFRIRSKGVIAQADWRHLARLLKKNKHAKEVVPKVDRIDDSMPAARRVIFELTQDLRDPKTLSRLMRDYYDDLTSDEWTKVDEMLAQYVKAAGGMADLARNVRWSLEELSFSNTFAYGDDNIVNFSKLSGITGIFAGNAMGKSSVIGTMMYALFNATDRGPIKNLHVINARKDGCEARAVVTINGVRHEIKRSSKKQITGKGLQHAITSLDFSRLDTGQSLNGEQRTVTEKKIRRTIGSPDDFMLTSLAVQGGLKAFISEGASQRKAILSRFLDLQIFEWINERAKQDSLALKGRIKDMPERDWDDMRTKLEAKGADLQRDVENLDRSLAESRNDLAKLRVELAGFGNTTYVSQGDIDKQKAHVDRLDSNLADLKVKLKKAQRSTESAEHRVEILERLETAFPYRVYREKEDKKQELEEWIFGLEQKLEKEHTLLEQKQRSVLKLAEVPCGDQYPTCKYIRDSHVDRDELPRLKSLVEEVRNDIGGKRTMLVSLLNDGSLDRLKRYRRIMSKENDYKLRLSQANHTQRFLERDMLDVGAQLQTARNKLEELRARVGKGDASLELRRIKDDIDDLEVSITSMDNERLDAAQKSGRIAAALEQLAAEREEYMKLADEWRAYERIIAATSKKGIPSQILRHLIPAINDEISLILNGIVGFTVELELPEDTNAMEVYIDYGDSRRIIELGSGMEKMVASIAIRVALINVSSLPKTDMLMIDEGFSELDETNIEACGNLLRSLTRWFRNIVIITHIDTLKDVVDNVIDITRIDKDAKVYHD